MSAYAIALAPPAFASVMVIAAVKVVLPWSTWPIVPMLQCGLFRLNFSLAIYFTFEGGGVPPCGLERVAGIEPAYSAWKAAALPLCYTRNFKELAGLARWP